MGSLVSSNLGCRCVMPSETLFGLVSGFFYGSIKIVDYISEDGIEVFNQSLIALHILGDFHFCDFLRPFFISCTNISSHTCSNFSDRFLSLLSHPAFTCFFPSSLSNFFLSILYVEFSSFFASCDSLHLQLNFLVQFFFQWW